MKDFLPRFPKKIIEERWCFHTWHSRVVRHWSRCPLELAARVVQQTALAGLYVFSSPDIMFKHWPLLKALPPAEAPLCFSLCTADSVDTHSPWIPGVTQNTKQVHSQEWQFDSTFQILPIGEVSNMPLTTVMCLFIHIKIYARKNTIKNITLQEPSLRESKIKINLIPQTLQNTGTYFQTCYLAVFT